MGWGNRGKHSAFADLENLKTCLDYLFSPLV